MLSQRILLVVLLSSVFVGASPAKPKVAIAGDGFPTGQSTPEGAASDLARAFIRRDVTLFRGVCIRPFGTGSDYTEYLVEVAAQFKEESALGTSTPDDPMKITKVFAA